MGSEDRRDVEGSVEGSVVGSVVVVLCGTDAAALGTLADELPVRAVVFVGDPAVDADRAALVEAVNELLARG